MVLLANHLQKNYGHGVGGRLIGLPITTGPFILIVCIQESRSFGARAAHGVLLGQIALAMFCWIYAWASSQFNWWISLTIGTAVCLTTGYLATQSDLSNTLVLVILALIWLIAMKSWPSTLVESSRRITPRWELPARVLVTMSVLVILSQLAPLLGANVSGALSTYPVIASVISAFNHKINGPSATIATLKGLMETLPFTVIFIAILAFAL